MNDAEESEEEEKGSNLIKARRVRLTVTPRQCWRRGYNGR